ncbi:MAG: hypothetical protein ACREJS_07015 [Candidatus Rokuibacteriota bacterium]
MNLTAVSWKSARNPMPSRIHIREDERPSALCGLPLPPGMRAVEPPVLHQLVCRPCLRVVWRGRYQTARQRLPHGVLEVA